MSSSKYLFLIFAYHVFSRWDLLCGRPRLCETEGVQLQNRDGLSCGHSHLTGKLGFPVLLEVFAITAFLSFETCPQFHISDRQRQSNVQGGLEGQALERPTDFSQSVPIGNVNFRAPASSDVRCII